MSYIGHIENGAVVLENGVTLPEGARVRVELFENETGAVEQTPTLLEQLQSVVGKAQGLPADASVNVDHYLYGHPKK